MSDSGIVTDAKIFTIDGETVAGWRVSVAIPFDLAKISKDTHNATVALAIVSASNAADAELIYSNAYGTEPDQAHTYIAVTGDNQFEENPNYTLVGDWGAGGESLPANSGWDTSYDDGSENASISLKQKDGDNYIYLKEPAEAPEFFVEMSLRAEPTLLNANNGAKFGFVLAKADGTEKLLLYIDAASENGTIKQDSVKIGYVYTSDWSPWGTQDGWTVGQSSDVYTAKDEFIRLGFCRKGSRLVLTLDGEMLGQPITTRFGATESLYVGLFSYDVAVTAKNWEIRTDSETLNKYDIAERFSVAFSSGASNATGDAPVQQSAAAGTQILLPENSFERVGYTFAGWSDGEKTYQAGASYQMPAHAVVFSAQWTANEYTVTYANEAEQTEGQVPVDDGKYHLGDTVTLKDCSLSRDGYDFAGWNDGEKTYQAGASYQMPAHNVTFTAQWREKTVTTYSVIYQHAEEYEGNDLPAQKEYAAGEQVTVGNIPYERDGYLFAGWSDGNKIYRPNETFEMPASAVTLTAVWEKDFVDGDISDWTTEEKTNPLRIPGSDGKKMVVYATMREDGVYVFFEVVHAQAVIEEGATWDAMTNVRIAFGTELTARYLTANGTQSGVTRGVFKTTNSDEGIFTTYVELFIAFEEIAGYTFDDASIPASFAWANPGETSWMWGDNQQSDVWTVPEASIGTNILQVTKSGFKTGSSHTIDGDFADWSGKTLSNGRSWTTQYGSWMTDYRDDGLYLAYRIVAPEGKGLYMGDAPAVFTDLLHLDFQNATGTTLSKLIVYQGELYYSGYITAAAMKKTEENGKVTQIDIEIYVETQYLDHIAYDVNEDSLRINSGGHLNVYSDTGTREWVNTGWFYLYNDGDDSSFNLVTKEQTTSSSGQEGNES